MINKRSRFTCTVVLASLLTASVGFSTYALGQSAETQTTTYQDWIVNCVKSETDQYCSMLQRLNLGDGGAQMSLELSPGTNGSASGVMIVPLGLDISKGISVNIDGGPRFNLPFRTCRQFGCAATISFSADIVDNLKKGSGLQTSLYQLNGAPELSIPFSLNGFSAAFADLKSR